MSSGLDVVTFFGCATAPTGVPALPLWLRSVSAAPSSDPDPGRISGDCTPVPVLAVPLDENEAVPEAEMSRVLPLAAATAGIAIIVVATSMDDAAVTSSDRPNPWRPAIESPPT